eukprot:COSAG02_NODE_1232_length_13753_cov_164.373810_7_plen_111_part_00
MMSEAHARAHAYFILITICGTRLNSAAARAISFVRVRARARRRSGAEGQPSGGVRRANLGDGRAAFCVAAGNSVVLLSLHGRRCAERRLHNHRGLRGGVSSYQQSNDGMP